MSCSNQDSIIQGSFPHKYGQGIWWGALNVVATTIPPITSGLASSLKLFLYSVAPSSNVPLTWPAHLSGFTVQVYRLLETILASLALGMTRGIITLLNLCIPQLQYYIDKPNPIIQCQKKNWMHFIFKYPKINFIHACKNSIKCIFQSSRTINLPKLLE